MVGKVFVMLLLSFPKGTDKGVLFTYYAPDAQSVYLVGDFNSWNTSANPMKKDKDGVWKIVIPLAPGKYQYKFFVDGRYEADPTNPITEGPYGNSVIRVGEHFKVLPPMMSNNTPMNSYVTFSAKAKGFLSIDRDSTDSYRLFNTTQDVRMGVNVNIQEEATLKAILHYNTVTGQDPSTHQIPFYFERAKLTFNKENLHFISFYNTFAYQSPDPVALIGRVNQFDYPFGRDEEGLIVKIEKPLSYDIHALYSNSLLNGRDLGFLRLSRQTDKLYAALFAYITHGNNIEYQVISPDSERANDSTFLHFNTYEDRILFGFEFGNKELMRYEFIMGKDIKRANYYDVDGTKTQYAPVDRKWNIGQIYKFRSLYGNKNASVFGDIETHRFDSIFSSTLGRGYTLFKTGGKLSLKGIKVEITQNFLLAGNQSTKWEALFRQLEINRLKYVEYPLMGYEKYIYLRLSTDKKLLNRLNIKASFTTARYALNQPPRADEAQLILHVPLGKLGVYYDSRYFHIKSSYLHVDRDFFDHYVEIYYKPTANLKLKTGYGFYPFNLLDEHTQRMEYLWKNGVTINQLKNNFRGLGGLIEDSEKQIAKNREIRIWLELSF